MSHKQWNDLFWDSPCLYKLPPGALKQNLIMLPVLFFFFTWCSLTYIECADWLHCKSLVLKNRISIKPGFSACPVFLPQVRSPSSVGTAPTVPHRRATWRPTSSASTASPLTTASTLTAASDAHTLLRGLPDCLRASQQIIAHQEKTRLAWLRSVGLDVVMATLRHRQ